MAIIQVGLKVVFFIDKNDGETNFAQLAPCWPGSQKCLKNSATVLITSQKSRELVTRYTLYILESKAKLSLVTVHL